MILPGKHVRPEESLLATGGLVLTQLGDGVTLSELWDSLQSRNEMGTLTKLVLALDLLYYIGAIEIRGELLVRVTR